MGIMGALGILFIALKLMGYVAWSWWLVLLPLYGGLMFALVAIIFMALFDIKRSKRK